MTNFYESFDRVPDPAYTDPVFEENCQIGKGEGENQLFDPWFQDDREALMWDPETGRSTEDGAEVQ